MELLVAEEIKQSLSIEASAKLGQLIVFETIDSTNQFLLTQIKQGAPSGSVCLAEFQTQGRGRLGRTWVAERGQNLCLSILWRFNHPNDYSTLSLSIGLMIAQFLKNQGIPQIKIKWPNDILYCARKLGGILIESPDCQNMVIGIGLNLKSPNLPEAIGLDDFSLSRNRFIGLLINDLLLGLSCYEQQGFTPFQSSWDEFDFLKTKPIVISYGNQKNQGIAEGINQHGQLILKTSTHELLQFNYGEATLNLAQ